MAAYFTTIDYSIFGILLSCSLAIGIYFGFFSDDVTTAEGYLVGGHTMKSFPIAVSLVASLISAISIIAYPAEVYCFGWQLALLLPTLIFITLGAYYLFLPVFYHNNIDNCYAYLELRFGKSIRELITVIFILIHFIFLPVINYIPSLALSEVTNLNIHVVNIVISYICAIYTMLGGIKSVVWTDVLQAGVMFGSVVLVAVLGIIKVGGMSEVWNRAVDGHRIFSPDLTLDLTRRTTFWNTVSGIFLIWTCYITFNQSCVQRLVSLPSLGEARKTLRIFLVGIIFIMTFNIGTGIVMYSYYYDCDPVKAGIITKYDKLMPRFVQDVAGHITGMPGIFISCVFSASLSSASAALHSFSGVVYNDYIRPRLYSNTDSNANLIMRTIILVMGSYTALGSFIVEHFTSIFELVITVSGIATAITFGAFTLGILCPFANHKGVLSGAIISMIVLTFIIVNTQYQTSLGNLHYDIIPTSIQGCDNDTISHIVAINATITQSNNEFAFYKIAFQWYPALGVLSMWIPAMIISYLTGGQNFENFNVQLLAPCIQRWVPRKYRHNEMKLMNKNNDHNDKLQTANYSNNTFK